MNDSISIEWESSGYSVLKNLNASVLGIFCEFIDNSIQSSKQQKDNILKTDPYYKLRIDIDYDGGNEIIIQDNAGGINEYNFYRALKPANKADDTKGLNEFGLGMKYAAVWISNEWELISSAIGEDVERSVIFNYDDVVRNNIKKLPFSTKKVRKETHYTKVKLRKLEQKHVKQFPYKILIKKIGFIYRNFIREKSDFFDDYREDNIEIYLFNDPKPLNWSEYGFLKKPWWKDLQVDLNKGAIDHEWKYKFPWTEIEYEEEVLDQRGVLKKVSQPVKISGFVGILPDGDHKLKNGFVLFRRGRVIEGSENRIFPSIISGASPRAHKYIRLYGEIHFDNVNVSFDKSKLSISQKRRDEIFGILATMIKKVVFETDSKRKFNLINQAEKHRPTFNIEDAEKASKKLISEADINRDEISIAEEIKISSISFDDKYIADEEKKLKNELLQKETLSQKHYIGEKEYDVIIQFGNELMLDKKLYTINSDSGKTLTVTINQSHLIFQNQENLKTHSYKLIINFIKCLAISEIKAIQQGNNARSVRYAFNSYLPIINNG